MIEFACNSCGATVVTEDDLDGMPHQNCPSGDGEWFAAPAAVDDTLAAVDDALVAADDRLAELIEEAAHCYSDPQARLNYLARRLDASCPRTAQAMRDLLELED